MPPYGGSIAQNVYYADQDLCDVQVDTTKGFPTRPTDPKTGKPEVWPSPYILMVDRGGCTFVQKVRRERYKMGAEVCWGRMQHLRQFPSLCIRIGPKRTTFRRSRCGDCRQCVPVQ